MKEEKLSYYVNKAAELGNHSYDKKIRVAILGSFTLNGLAETIQVKCAEKKLQCHIYVGGYNQYNQEILNPQSNLYKFQPDLTFLLIDTRTLLKDLFHHPHSISAEERKSLVDEKTKEILDLVVKFSKTTSSKLILANFAIPRISQLTLKTNQFNLTTKRYQENDIKKFAQDKNYLVGCAQVEDKFGDNGITGVFIVNKKNPKEWYLDTFLLSCRVMGREVEKGILSHIIDKAKEAGVQQIRAEFIPTQKNKPIEGFLPNCGFKKESNSWVYSIDVPFEIPSCLTVSVE